MSIAKKLECVNWFVGRVVEKLVGRIYRIVLFGNVAKGYADERYRCAYRCRQHLRT
ncbi:MAG: hypothetical protein ACP5LQ_08330 [Candidatus Methanodesulfokora sp.]